VSGDARAAGAGSGRLRIGVLASGAGTNLQALLDGVHGREVEVVAVASDKDAAPALGRAEAAGVPTRTFPREDFPDRPARDAAITAWLAEREVQLVVLAGYMALLDAGFTRRWEGRLVNVHPSLLPAFPGIAAVQQALDYGVKVFGVTVHFVDEGVDTGAIILQRAIELPGATDAAAVLEALRPLEHALLPEAVRLMAAGLVHRDPAHPRRIVVAGR
jgi:phosphoribosylglycinamide formyltransferase-1